MGIALLGMEIGCTAESRYRMLSTVFDGVPKPGEERPSRRRPVRMVRVEPAPSAPVPAAPAEARPLSIPAAPSLSFASFAELEQSFPKDAVGNIHWVAAADAGLISPRPGIDPDTADLTPMPLDVRLDPGIPVFQVVFPHRAHTYWLRCDNCHPGIFQMRAGADPITMEAIFQGEYCGRCHGKVAFAPETACMRCHPKLGGAG